MPVAGSLMSTRTPLANATVTPPPASIDPWISTRPRCRLVVRWSVKRLRRLALPSSHPLPVRRLSRASGPLGSSKAIAALRCPLGRRIRNGAGCAAPPWWVEYHPPRQVPRRLSRLPRGGRTRRHPCRRRAASMPHERGGIHAARVVGRPPARSGSPLLPRPAGGIHAAARCGGSAGRRGPARSVGRPPPHEKPYKAI